jgi:predicted aldo/keto reductase-like oxidoreductase
MRRGGFVSELCLGAMTFGGGGGAQIWEALGGLDQPAATALVHRALDAGINFIDTANVYAAGDPANGHSRAPLPCRTSFTSLMWSSTIIFKSSRTHDRPARRRSA